MPVFKVSLYQPGNVLGGERNCPGANCSGGVSYTPATDLTVYSTLQPVPYLHDLPITLQQQQQLQQQGATRGCTSASDQPA